MTGIDSTEQSHGIYKYLPTCRSSTNTWLLFYYICPCYVEIHHAFYNRITIYCWPTCFSLSKTTQQNKQPWQKLMWPPTHYGVNQSNMFYNGETEKKVLLNIQLSLRFGKKFSFEQLWNKQSLESTKTQITEA